MFADVDGLRALVAAGEAVSRSRSEAGSSFMRFCQAVDPKFVSPPHIRAVQDCLEAVRLGTIDRLMIFMPPRHGKSLTAAGTFPAYYLGHHPDHHVMLVSYQADLAEGFSHRNRVIMSSEAYRGIFPDTKLLPGRARLKEWHTTAGGKVMAFGMQSGVTGRGADLVVLDDLLSGRLDAMSASIRERAWQTFANDVYTRLYMGGRIVLSNTRWHEDDPPGRLFKQMKEAGGGGDQWHVLNMPALDETETKALWPEMFSVDALLRIKRAVGKRAWMSLYQQQPVDEGGEIVRKDAWRAWPEGKQLPSIVHLMQVWDTAFETNEESDESACTTWGVFRNEELKRYEMILLGAWSGRLSFPDLKRRAVELYDIWHESACGPVDRVLIEPKATGKPLVSEIRRAGVPAVEFQVVRGDKGREVGKVPKAHLASVVWDDGAVWYVPGSKAAQPVIDQCAAVGGPSAQHDDLADTAFMAAIYLRRTWWMTADGDVKPPTFRLDNVLERLRRAPVKKEDEIAPAALPECRDDWRKMAEYRELGVS